MSLLSRFWDTVEASLALPTTPPPPLLGAPQPSPLDTPADPEPAPSSATTDEGTDMHKNDQEALVAIFNDLYGKVQALNTAAAQLGSAVSQLSTSVSSLQSQVDGLMPAFDASAVKGYTAPAPVAADDTPAAGNTAESDPNAVAPAPSPAPSAA